MNIKEVFKKMGLDAKLFKGMVGIYKGVPPCAIKRVVKGVK